MSSAELDAVWADPRPYVTEREASHAVLVAATEMVAVIGSQRAAMAWSGGKDSIALELVIERSGLSMGGVCGVAADLEIPSALAWYRAHRPQGIEIIDRGDMNLAWLKAHPEFLFPEGGVAGQVFTKGVTRWSQHRYIDDVRPDVMVTGRRRADGNWIEGKDAHGLHQSHQCTWYSPLRDWSHALTLAVIRYADRELPPTYSWANGWTTGTGPWPGWRLGLDVGRSYLAEISPETLARAQEAGVL